MYHKEVTVTVYKDGIYTRKNTRKGFTITFHVMGKRGTILIKKRPNIVTL